MSMMRLPRRDRNRTARVPVALRPAYSSWPLCSAVPKFPPLTASAMGVGSDGIRKCDIRGSPRAESKSPAAGARGRQVAFLRPTVSASRHRISNIIWAPVSPVVPEGSKGGATSTTSPATMSRAAQSPQHLLGLPGGEAADLGGPGAGRVHRVEPVDVEAHVCRPAARDLAGLLDDGRDPHRVQVLDVDDGHARLVAEPPQRLGGVRGCRSGWCASGRARRPPPPP